MLQGWSCYRGCACVHRLLFLVASYGDRTRGLEAQRTRATSDLPAVPGDLLHIVDVLCSVGFASRTGFDFLTIYIGPALMIGLRARC